VPRAAIAYAQAIAGARPDLQPAPASDVVIAEVLARAGVVGADAPAFGRLDPRRALPRGRAFQLLDTPPPPGAVTAAPVLPPAHYRTATGESESIALALRRAQYEGGLGRLEQAARAAGLLDRFRAADLAVLSISAPTPARPALSAFIPSLGGPPGGRWTLDLLGDDLAWVAGLPQPDVDWPPERALHARWRKLWRGELAAGDPAGDPSIAALGPSAVEATRAMLAALKR
jgi:hypothetical protein